VSPRAAWRLESLGFRDVYDYVAGKKDWGAAGLPREGRRASEPSAGEHARRDVPTCRLDERLQGVRARVRAAGWDICIVANEERVVLGRLGRRALASEEDVTAEGAMTEGPGTLRPSYALEAALSRMRDRDLTRVLITTSDGRLVGLLLREDAERALADG
jgi:CBS domain-containing protein